MAFRNDGRAFNRLDRPDWGDAFRPSIQEEARGALVIPETPASRPINYLQPDANIAELPRSRPWLQTANGMLGPQTNTIGFRGQWVEGNTGAGAQQGLYVRSQVSEDLARDHIAPTGVFAAPLSRRSNLMEAPYEATPYPMPVQGHRAPQAQSVPWAEGFEF
jgi:hypothetical protein